MTFAINGEGGDEVESGVKCYATATGVLNKVNKFKFDLFSWICGGQAGLNR